MSVTSVLKFVQSATGPGPGIAMLGDVGSAVTASNQNDSGVVEWTYTILGVPPGSSIPVGVVQTGSGASYTFTPDVTGGYLLELTVTDSLGNTATSIPLCFGINETSGRFIPPFLAIAPSVNFGGQAFGWAPYIQAYLKAVDAGVAGSTVLGTGLWYSTVGALFATALTLVGDVSMAARSGDTIPLTVTAIQSAPVVSTPPSSGEFLMFNGTHYAPVSVSGNGTLSSSGVLAVTNLTLSGQVTGAVSYFDGSDWRALVPGVDGYVLQTNGSGFAPSWVSISGGSGFVAGHDLSGTSTSQEVIGILGHSLAPFANGYLAVVSGVWDFVTNVTATNLNLSSEATGSITYYNGTNWVVLLPSTSGYLLQTNGSTAPTWVPASGGGGGYTSTTGDVVSSGSGAVATVIEAVSGASAGAQIPIAQGSLYIGGQVGSASVGAIYWGGLTPSSSNPALVLFGSNTQLNVGTGGTVGLAIGGTNVFSLTSPGSGFTATFDQYTNLLLGTSPVAGGMLGGLTLGTPYAAPTAVGSNTAAIYGVTGGALGINASGITIPGFQGVAGVFEITATAPATGNGVSFSLLGGPPGSDGLGGSVGLIEGGGGGFITVQDVSLGIAINGTGFYPIAIGAGTSGVVALGNVDALGVTLTAGTAGLGVTSGEVIGTSESVIDFDGVSSGDITDINLGAVKTAGLITIGNTDQSAMGVAIISGGGAGGSITFQMGGGAPIFSASFDTGTEAWTGSASALPALPVGYERFQINGTTFKRPYYADTGP